MVFFLSPLIQWWFLPTTIWPPTWAFLAIAAVIWSLKDPWRWVRIVFAVVVGYMAVTMALRLDESGGRLAHVPIIMLLDRRADVHLARRSGADGWLVKPLDAFRINKAVTTVLDGGTYTEGISTKIVEQQPAAAG